MKFLILSMFVSMASVNSTEPIYAHSLRHVPEKLRQERTLQEVLTKVKQVTQVILNEAQHQNESNFTLFCHEPNEWSDQFQENGDTYRLPELGKRPDSRRPIYPKPKCSLKDGYDLYRRSTMDHQTKMDPKTYPPLPYETPTVSIQLFFQYFNQQFPDLRLTILHERKAISTNRMNPTENRLFETDCCPIYTVSWKE